MKQETWRPGRRAFCRLATAPAVAFRRLPILSFVARDRMADAIFLTVQASLLPFAEMTVMFRHIRLLAVLEIGFSRSMLPVCFGVSVPFFRPSLLLSILPLLRATHLLLASV